MKYTYMRKTTGHTSTDYKTNTEFSKEINITPVLDKIQEYIKHINKTPRDR
jgi:hypothetical protein